MERFDLDKVTEILAEENVVDTEHFAPSVMVAFGYRKEEPKDKVRQPAEDVIEWIDIDNKKRVKTLFIIYK